jgi:excinuclease ABC subunit C
MNELVVERIRNLPDRPGIYVFKDQAGKVLYVGKAKSLRKRAANYLQDPADARLAAMLDEAADLEFLVADTEAEALYLENNWIKQKKPRYNVRLRDDKTYPYLKLTSDPYPRLAFTRRIRDDGADYYGPYLPAGIARRAIKLVQRLFQVRVCDLPIDGSLPRPCLYHDMRRCLGPCVAGLTTQAAYADAVQQARLFLAGRNEELLRSLRRGMLAASDRLEFEEAARLRDAIAEVEAIGERRKLSSSDTDEDLDVFGVLVAGEHAAVVILVMRGGQLLDRRELFFEGIGRVDAGRLLSELLPQVYERTTFIPKEIHLPFAVEGDEALQDVLSERKGERVYLRLPARGAKAERVALAMHNAELAWARRFRGAEGDSPGAAALQRHLDLQTAPQRIEGFDISNFQGAETVASLVVWEAGKMRRSDYRSFNIRSHAGIDDFASMREAVLRRYRRQLEELGVLPDLILIDGGRGQLNAALAALAELGADDATVVSLAKREEEVYLPGLPEPLRLRRDDPGLRLLQEIRDEAHRFAVTRHRKRRTSRLLRGRLDDLAGIGPKRRQALLRRFGSVEGVRGASEEALAEVVGPRLAARLREELRRLPEADPPGAAGDSVPG